VLEGQASRLADAEHARAALELRLRRATAEHERLHSIINRISEPVLAVDQYGEVFVANASAERLLSLSSATDDKSTSTPESRVSHGLEHCERLLSLINDARRRNSPTARAEELELETETGEKHNFSVTVSCLGSTAADAPDRGRNCEGVVAVMRDISSQKQMQRNHAEFVSAASHEMKAPLAGIKAYVELLADGDAEDEETREQFLNVISGQTERLQRLIENLLNIARIEAGVVKVNKQQQPLNELLAEALRVCGPTAEAKNITLRNDLSPLYLGALVDRDMMLQAAINLLSNAVKYTPVGGTVTLRSRHAGTELQFEVEDTGVGLSPEDCVKIFSKFYRVEKDQHMAAGTGLGLSLARHIVEDVHGGRLTVASQLDVGSTFTVTLPIPSKNSG
jgi:two-component system phosphate regulon sensor histidine kinase PhoR